jgi:hypothetical protein
MGHWAEKVACVLKGSLTCCRLDLAVVKLSLRVDVQPSSSLIVLVALDVASLSLPIVA